MTITSALATVGSEQTSEIGVTLEKHDGTTAFIPIKLSSAVDMDVFGEGASLTISLSNIPIFQDGQSTHLGVDFSVEVSRSTGDDGERQSLDQKINNFLDEFDKLMAQVGGGSLLPVPGQTVLRDALKTEVESVLLTRDALDKIATDLAQAVSYSGPDFSGDLSGIENLLKGDVLDGVRLIP